MEVSSFIDETMMRIHAISHSILKEVMNRHSAIQANAVS